MIKCAVPSSGRLNKIFFIFVVAIVHMSCVCSEQSKWQNKHRRRQIINAFFRFHDRSLRKFSASSQQKAWSKYPCFTLGCVDERDHYNCDQFGDREINIYFPSDLQQPNTKDAIVMSCANVRDPCVTDWYMKVFSVYNDMCYPFDLARFQHTCHADANCKINCGIIGKKIIDLSYINNKEHKKKIQDAIKQILSTSVGRVLFYRILIELLRCDNSNNTGNQRLIIMCKYPSTMCGYFIKDKRINCMQMNINFAEPKNLYVILCDNIYYVSGSHICDKCLSAIIMHELIHWLQRLTRRPTKIANCDTALLICDTFWKVKNQTINSYDFECISCTRGDSSTYGICENLYREEIGLPLRFGHIWNASIQTPCMSEDAIEKYQIFSRLIHDTYNKQRDRGREHYCDIFCENCSMLMVCWRKVKRFCMELIQ